MIHTTMQNYTPALRMRILRMADRAGGSQKWRGSPGLEADVMAQRDKCSVTIGASLSTVAEWARYGCTIYDCNDVKFDAGRRVLSDLRDHGSDPLATARALLAEWATMRGVTAPDSGCVVLGIKGSATDRGMWGPWDVRDGVCGAAIARMAQRGERYRPFLEPHHNGQAAVVTALTFRWAQPGMLQGWEIDARDRLMLQIDLEGYTVDGAPFHAVVGAGDDGRFIMVDRGGAAMRDGSLAAFAILYGLTLVIGLHSAAITYYTPKRRKGQKRRGRGGKGRTTLRTCKLDTERWACRVRKPGLKLLPTPRKPVASGHVPVPYAGAGYHVGCFTRGTWVREESVRDGEEWLDIKESKRGGLLVKVARECNAEGYMVGTPTPRLVLVKPA